jgi:dihydroorotase
VTDRLIIRRPDDWHVHLRDGAMLTQVAPYTARQFARAIVMPNLAPPVTTVAAAEAYRARIRAALPGDARFEPLMTCYLTDGTDPDDLRRGHAEGVYTAVKLYPANATTNSAHGVSRIAAISAALEAMQEIGMPLLVHGEVTDPDVDVFDREAVFIDRILAPLLADYPALRIVLEHITTREAAAFVLAHPDRVGATVTPQHMAINRNALFAGGLRPHAYCLPVLKREQHRVAVRQAATSGAPNIFLGTDSAPHVREAKESACGCAGIFSAATAIELYAEMFEEDGALDRFEAFASENGPRFYGLPQNTDTITLERRDQSVPETIGGEEAVVPFRAGDTLRWTFCG